MCINYAILWALILTSSVFGVFYILACWADQEKPSKKFLIYNFGIVLITAWLTIAQLKTIEYESVETTPVLEKDMNLGKIQYVLLPNGKMVDLTKKCGIIIPQKTITIKKSVKVYYGIYFYDREDYDLFLNEQKLPEVVYF